MRSCRSLFKSGFLYLFMASILGGCTEDSPYGHVITDHGFSIIRQTKIESISPEKFSQGSNLEITLVIDSRYAGLADIGIVGHFQGSDVGRLLEPIEGALGGVGFEQRVQPGRNEVNFVVEMTTPSPAVSFVFFVSIDSLAVDDELVYWRSSEGYAVYREDIPPNNAFLSNSSDKSIDVFRSDEQ